MSSYLFCFNPEAGSAMADRAQPELQRWRRIQLARHLVEVEGGDLDMFSFDSMGAIAQIRVPRRALDEVVTDGRAFMTNGCPGEGGVPGCTRPYGSYRPVEAFRDYPFAPEAGDLVEIGRQLHWTTLSPRSERWFEVRIVVPLKAVPDLVEEIDLTADETGIDPEYLKFILNEWDGQALEEALLVKDASGAEVVAVGVSTDVDIDQILYTALAKGADVALKLSDSGEATTGALSAVSHRAALLAGYLACEPADLVITGVQASDDPDGQLAPMLAAMLDLPHVSVVVSIEEDGRSAKVRQEFAGGRSHELEVELPAVIGVQSARQPPRYAPISRIKQAMQAGGLKEVTVSPGDRPCGLTVRRMHKPEIAAKGRDAGRERQ